MPYINDPRRTVTLNLPPDEFSALAVDATRAGHPSPGTYAMALVRARGEAPRPVLDEHGRLRVARLNGKLEVMREALAAATARANALAAELQAARRELEGRPTRAAVHQAIAEGVAAHVREATPPTAAAPVPAALTPEERAEARARRAREREREAGRP